MRPNRIARVVYGANENAGRASVFVGPSGDLVIEGHVVYPNEKPGAAFRVSIKTELDDWAALLDVVKMGYEKNFNPHFEEEHDDDGSTNPNENYGAVWILFMNSNGTVRTHQKISDTAGTFSAPFLNQDHFGWAVAGIGDLNGDGVEDLAVGAELDQDGGSRRGAVSSTKIDAMRFPNWPPKRAW